MSKVRVRFAPSPTGYLHIGSLRTALYDYLFAKQQKGTFILRIEDTDQKRYVEGSVEKILQSLYWAGIKNDEGVKINDNGVVYEEGELGPYIQSKRKEIYRKHAEQLVAAGKAYYCFCEPERLEELRKSQAEQKKPPMYDRYCLRNLDEEQVNKKLKENCSYVIRLKMSEEKIELDDIIRGHVSFESEGIDDPVLLKSDGFPTYHLASVVDDHLMKIKHVIRGEEWLSSVPKHIALYRAFGWNAPEFAHLPLLLNSDRSKLSKRQGDVAVEDYIEKGYLKEALINFVALLGWNPGKGSTQELFSLEDLVKNFDLAKVHKGGAVFDQKKLDWLNSQYIKKLSPDELYRKSLKFFGAKDFYVNADDDRKSEEYLKKVLKIEQERLTVLSEVGESNQFFFRDPVYDKKLLGWKNMTGEDVKLNLEKAQAAAKKIGENDWTPENLEKIFAEEAGDKRGQFFWPLRVALTGEEKSPPPHEVAWVLGEEESLRRIKKALEKL